MSNKNKFSIEELKMRQSPFHRGGRRGGVNDLH